MSISQKCLIIATRKNHVARWMLPNDEIFKIFELYEGSQTEQSEVNKIFTDPQGMYSILKVYRFSHDNKYEKWTKFLFKFDV